MIQKGRMEETYLTRKTVGKECDCHRVLTITHPYLLSKIQEPHPASLDKKDRVLGEST